MIKKLLLLSAFLMASASASAADFIVDGIAYNIIDKESRTVGVRSNNHAYSGDINIPSTVVYNNDIYTVTSIGNHAFSGCSGLTSVTIPDAVTYIDRYAFYGCSGMEELNFNAIECEDFNSCPLPSSLKRVTIGDKVTRIPANFLNGCSDLTSVTIPDAVTYIGHKAFSGCSGMEELNFNAIECADYSYYSGPFTATSLKRVTFGDKVTRIPAYLLYARSGLTSVTIPDAVTYIGSYAFYNCGGLTSVNIPDAVTEIGGGAFSGCRGLTSVTIPDAVTYIGSSAFSDCSGLTSVNIPESVTEISQSAFSGCSGLTSVNIPESVTEIGPSAFYGCSGLTSVTIPESVTEIGPSAFYGCSGMEELNFNAIECADINSYTLPFSLKRVIFGDKVTRIPSSLLYECGYLTFVTIPDAVTEIGPSAFKYCDSLTSVTIPESVTSIGGGAFYGCSGLTSVTIGDAVTKIGSYAFYGCSGLTSVTIPDAVTEIGKNAFKDCRDLKSVTIGESLTDIDIWIFENCNRLEELNFNAIKCADSNFNLNEAYSTMFKRVTFGDKVTRIPGNLLYNSKFLTSVTIPDAVTEIGPSAFYGCSGLTSVTIGESVTEIGSYAFNGCYNLMSINVKTKQPPHVENDFALGDAYEDATLYVPTGSKSAYEAVDPWRKFLHIVETDFGGVESIDSDGVSVAAKDGQIVVTGAENATIEVVNLNGQTVYRGNDATISVPSRGIYIVSVAGMTFKVII